MVESKAQPQLAGWASGPRRLGPTASLDGEFLFSRYLTAGEHVPRGPGETPVPGR